MAEMLFEALPTPSTWQNCMHDTGVLRRTDNSHTHNGHGPWRGVAGWGSGSYSCSLLMQVMNNNNKRCRCQICQNSNRGGRAPGFEFWGRHLLRPGTQSHHSG